MPALAGFLAVILSVLGGHHRANADRKIMPESGLQKNQVHAVRGFADRRWRRPENPMDFSNRRVSILAPPPAGPAADSDPAGGKLGVGG